MQSLRTSILILVLYFHAAGVVLSGAIEAKFSEYATVTLSADLGTLTENEIKIIPVLVKIADIMDEIFWLEVFGEKNLLLNGIKDEFTRKFALLHYGPWDRLDNNRPFVAGFGARPAGDNYYPGDLTKEAFDRLGDTNKTSRYTLIKRAKDGALSVVWYHEAFKEQVEKASGLLLTAARLADDPGFKKYLESKAEDLLSDDYDSSDRAWMNLKNSGIDFIVGPSEVGDRLFRLKTSHEAIILVRDRERSVKLSRYISILPKLQKTLPVDDAYKRALASSFSDMGAYDAVYCTGDANCASKTVAICLPSDENLRLKTGARRFLLRNVIKAKYDNILVPLAAALIDPAQKRHVSFEAFFNNLMFLILSEIAYGPGTPQTINGRGSVRDALGEADAAFVEGKAAILGLYFIVKLVDQGEITDCSVEDAFAVYVVNMLRSIRRGIDSPDGKANMMCFNYLIDSRAISRTPGGKYMIDCEKMRAAVSAWLRTVMEIQGNGDKENALRLMREKGSMSSVLRSDLERLKVLNIPKDVIYRQGIEVLGIRVE